MLSLQIAYVLGLICIICGIGAILLLVWTLAEGRKLDYSPFVDRLFVVMLLTILSVMCVAGMRFVSVFIGGWK